MEEMDLVQIYVQGAGGTTRASEDGVVHLRCESNVFFLQRLETHTLLVRNCLLHQVAALEVVAKAVNVLDTLHPLYQQTAWSVASVQSKIWQRAGQLLSIATQSGVLPQSFMAVSACSAASPSTMPPLS